MTSIHGNSHRALHAYYGSMLEKYHSRYDPRTGPGPQVPSDSARSSDVQSFNAQSNGVQPSDLPPLQSDISGTRPIHKVAVVGGGVAGLYAAMMLGSNYNVDVYEASGRLGGRLFTHHFTQDKWYYFDVGAMRFPHTPVMEKTFQLFDDLGIKRLPYKIIEDKNWVAYNLERYTQEQLKAKTFADDPFKVGSANGGTVPDFYAQQDPSELLHSALEDLIQALVDDHEKGVIKLMGYDGYSTRNYLMKEKNFPPSLVDYLETMCFGTGWFDRALAETVFEELCFLYNKKSSKDLDWYCVEGGSEKIIEKLRERLETSYSDTVKINMKHRVTAATFDRTRQMITISGLDWSSCDSENCTASEKFRKEYSHVIFAVPPPCLRAIDLSKCNLDYQQRNAIRQVSVGPSCKIGIKFKTAWWTKQGITGGQSTTDRLARTIVYPSYGDGQSTVLIASYSWTQDAVSLGAFMQGPKSPEEERLKELMLADLAEVHGLRIEDLREEFVDMFPWDWSHHPDSMGAFGLFGPTQFRQFYTALTRPAAGGHMHFVGETISTTHGWVAGALESAERGVFQILELNTAAVQTQNQTETSRGEADGVKNYPVAKFMSDWRPDLGVRDDRLIMQLQISKTLQVAEFGPVPVPA